MNDTSHIASDLQILECTLRDGSYPVDFRFTPEDTAVLCRMLSMLGFKLIEMGHGLGINASDAGKGKMSSSDLDLLKAAKSKAGQAKIGMFCIPGIATLESLNEIADHGLDFVRIGNDPEHIEKVFPFVEAARKHNLLTMVNFMKSYAVSPETFAQKAKEAVHAGGEVVYLVDSAGGMLPHEIAEYISAVKSKVNVKLGIHSHNNLHLATANAIEAVKNGVSYVDTTLYGLGRSAGNVPTEVMVAILNNMGIDVGVDLFKLMDVAEKYLAPLMEKIKMHDMLSVSMGAGKFHSGFYPKVKEVADRYKTDVRKLIYLMGKKNPSNISEKELIETAQHLGAQEAIDDTYNIVSFYSPKMSRENIANTLESVAHLIESLIDISAKAKKKIVIEVSPANSPDDNFVLAEYVTSDQDMVMGKFYFGSIKVLENILPLIKSHIALLIITEAGDKQWIKAEDMQAVIEKYIAKEFIILLDDTEILQKSYFTVIMKLAAHHFGKENLLVYGGGKKVYDMIKECSKDFGHIYWLGTPVVSSKEDRKMITLESLDDWEELNLKFNIILCASNPSETDAQILKRSRKDNGKIMVMGFIPALDLKDDNGNEVYSLNLNQAYMGLISQWLGFNEGLLGKP